MRSRKVSMDTAVYRPIPGTDEEVEIEVEVVGDLEPYFAGSRDEPPSGGGVDDLRALFSDFRQVGSGKSIIRREIPLTEEERRDFADQLAETDMDDPPEYEPPDDEYDFERPEAYDD